jgi:hypothetical protein
MTVAVLLALVGLTPGILGLLGAPSVGALLALSVADKVTLATTIAGLIPHDAKTRRLILAKIKADAKLPHGNMVSAVNGGPLGWGRPPVVLVYRPKGERP